MHGATLALLFTTTTKFRKGICIKITDRFTNMFCQHLRDVERTDKDASKPVAPHFGNVLLRGIEVCLINVNQLKRRFLHEQINREISSKRVLLNFLCLS